MSRAEPDPGVAWMLAFQAGDDLAFDKVVEEYQGVVFGMLRKILGPHPMVEDLAQEIQDVHQLGVEILAKLLIPEHDFPAVLINGEYLVASANLNKGWAGTHQERNRRKHGNRLFQYGDAALQVLETLL